MEEFTTEDIKILEYMRAKGGCIADITGETALLAREAGIKLGGLYSRLDRLVGMGKLVSGPRGLCSGPTYWEIIDE